MGGADVGAGVELTAGEGITVGETGAGMGAMGGSTSGLPIDGVGTVHVGTALTSQPTEAGAGVEESASGVGTGVRAGTRGAGLGA